MLFSEIIGDIRIANAFAKSCASIVTILAILKRREDVRPEDITTLDLQVRGLGELLEVALSGLDDAHRPNLSVPKIHALLHFWYF